MSKYIFQNCIFHGQNNRWDKHNLSSLMSIGMTNRKNCTLSQLVQTPNPFCLCLHISYFVFEYIQDNHLRLYDPCIYSMVKYMIWFYYRHKLIVLNFLRIILSLFRGQFRKNVLI